MVLGLNDDQRSIVRGIERILREFDDDYWLNLDRTGEFPHKFYSKIAAGGWLGIAMPTEVGGAGLGVTDAALMMMTVANSGGGMTAASAIHMNIFGPRPIVCFGNQDQQREWLPPIIHGSSKCCIGVTEPDAGLDTGSITTFASKTDSGYRISGTKIWTSTAQYADKLLLLARTTPKDQCRRGTDGLSLFYVDLDRKFIEVKEIEKMGRKAVDSNMIYIDNMPASKHQLVGDEGKGFQYLLHGLNAERILIGMEAVGLGRNALERAARYAKERVVFGRPIGKNQSIQHPLAEAWVRLEAANLMCIKAAELYDANSKAGSFANAAKYLGAEAGYFAAKQAVLTLGGMGYAKEYHVERLMREAIIPVLAPISAQLCLSYIAEKALGLPKSY